LKIDKHLKTYARIPSIAGRRFLPNENSNTILEKS
jgi:hypothetical protein